MNAALVLLSLTLWPAAPVAAQVPRDTPPPVIENARRERDLRATVAAGTATKDTYLELARLATLQNRYDDTIAALQAAAALEPDSPEAQHFPAPMCWEYARRDTAPDGAAKLRYLQAGLAAEDRALALKPDYLEALTFKNILLRMKANLTTDAAEQARLIAEADALRNRALELQRQAAPQRSDVE